jgi:uncharacterized membrane protein
MAFLIVIASGIVGFVVGAGVGDGSTAALGFFGGLALGFAFARLQALSRRLDALQRAVDTGASSAARSTSAAMHETARVPADIGASTDDSPSPVGHAPVVATPPAIIDSAARRAGAATGATRPSPAASPSAPAAMPGATFASAASAAELSSATEPSPTTRAAGAIRRWFTEGNVPVKVGMLVLIAGFAALIKYATDQGWLRFPIELRLIAIAIVALAGLALGWRERVRRRAFGLALQGGALGVLLMTVFAAFRVYALVPATPAFAAMIALVATAGALAVAQDALALALFGTLAGFAAPILISTSAGDHVVLFSYYAILDLGILAIALGKSWRALNLVGFAFTWIIGTAWGVLRYEPVLFDTTEPFLIAFFAIYLAIPILHARQRTAASSGEGFVDGTLVFGNPLIAFLLQAALLDGARRPLAISALALAAVYAILAVALRRANFGALRASFAVLAVGFATLAIPLALSARTTACTFALEGAALIWLGFRQHRQLPRWSGLALQAIAAVAFFVALANGSATADTMAIANGSFMSAMLIVGAVFASSALYARSGANAPLALLLYLLGLAGWIAAGFREVYRFAPPTREAYALLGFAAATAVLAGAAWRSLHRPALAWTVAAAFVATIVIAIGFGIDDIRPFASWGLGAFALYAIAGGGALALTRSASRGALGFAHAGWIWTWTIVASVALRQLVRDADLASGWQDAATLLPLIAAWTLAIVRPAWIAPPLGDRFAEWRAWLCASQGIVALTAFVGLLSHPGDAAPVRYVPILNPVEIAELAIVFCAARWLADPAIDRDLARSRFAIVAGAGFLFVTVATLRAVHHLAGAPWDARIVDSAVAQTALTLVWSALGVVGWVWGSRRGSRPLWLAGAALMAIVLAKLLLVDRTHLGSAFGIASFIAYGLLCTFIGYVAPAPPRTAAAK